MFCEKQDVVVNFPWYSQLFFICLYGNSFVVFGYVFIGHRCALLKMTKKILCLEARGV